MEKGAEISILPKKCKQSNPRILVSDFIVLLFYCRMKFPT
jgi:hypothetical protein